MELWSRSRVTIPLEPFDTSFTDSTASLTDYTGIFEQLEQPLVTLHLPYIQGRCSSSRQFSYQNKLPKARQSRFAPTPDFRCEQVSGTYLLEVMKRLELLTWWLQITCSANWATRPFFLQEYYTKNFYKNKFWSRIRDSNPYCLLGGQECYQLHQYDLFGRGRGIRTPNQRYQKPLRYQLRQSSMRSYLQQVATPIARREINSGI